MSAFPPQRSVASIPVSQDIALKYLAAYLEAAKSSPHLLPNARLEPSGPTAGPSSSNITIHNLQRVEAGLRGEWLAPTLDLEEGNVPIAAGMDDGTNKEQQNGEAEGWMDLDQYQREQSIEGGEIGVRVPGAVQDAELDSDLEMLDHAPKKPLDKAARREEKKQRLKQEKRQREMKRAGQLAD
ncbi:hypothetical protein ONS95_002277 [Cadophora gregata]|uniref:uncharacterized protein n=1 Tax=Cadophora gregata TaxID=51156 RepID=UPI0026DDA9DA|nr:uncharacterized protein ONS95_002277 [Cadophora gregata]KAK0109592.1 hypothetical protein ONS95_002277 [Cadophora gregata]KAK0110776.1 hypothetical protein ONS96_002373 [Cadophora gregata f. sp. sojae]